MNGRALYNEIDPYCAAWLRNLIQRGLICPGDVVECSIEDIHSADLKGYNQFHTFAGIGLWSYALRQAGVPDTANVWTGSCPCQPFSAAGKGDGFADERHLWPAFFHLVAECRPPKIVGEQVASKDGLAWLDLVQSDMEGSGYAFGAVDSCSAGFGAPHIRQRLYWVADDSSQQCEFVTGGCKTGIRREGAIGELCSLGILEHAERTGPQGHVGNGDHRDEPGRNDAGADRHAPASSDALDQLADANNQSSGRWRIRGHGQSDCQGARSAFERPERLCEAGQLADDSLIGCGKECSDAGGFANRDRSEGDAAGFVHGRNADIVADADGGHTYAERLQRSGQQRLQPQDDFSLRQGHCGIGHNSEPGLARPGPTNGFWSNPDWLYCRDAKWRPVEPGTFPLAHGLPRSMGTGSAELQRLAKVAGLDAKSLARAKEYRVGSLRAYGNAINAEQATEFCRVVRELI